MTLIELDIDGHVDAKGIQYIGKALLQPSGKWHCLANVNGALCKVEVSIVPEVMSSEPKEPRTSKPDAKSNKVIGWACYEIIAGSPEALEHDKKLQVSRWKETDEADKYRPGAPYIEPAEQGGISIPVLEFLNGRPWDNAALNVVHSLRPSSIRTSIGGGGDANSYPWRVTVSLKEDNCTIERITQEVEVGLTGCRYGADVLSYIEDREPIVGSGAVFNSRGLKNLKTTP